MTPEPTTTEPTTDESPFITIWDAPRETVRRVVARDPRRHVNLLFFAAGAVATLDGVAQLSDQVPMPPLALPILCALTGLFSIPLAHLGAWYKRLVGRLLGGQASQREVVAVAAWSSVPTVVGHAVLWGVRLAVYGTAVLEPGHTDVADAPSLTERSLALAAMLFTFWSFYVSIVGFAEVNRFSIARSVATSVLTPLLMITAFIAILVAVIVYRASR
jgi:hypothetical protein